jgi:hypothetical protein
VLVALIAWLMGAPIGPLQAAERRDLRATLDVILVHRPLEALTEQAMRSEAERIWEREGVRLRWRASDEEVPEGPRFLRVQLVDEPAAAAPNRSEAVLGDFRPALGSVRVSLASAAQATTAGLVSYGRPLQPFDYPLALGYVLGRAIAHEIGHSLLGGGHVEIGLMQRAFNPRQLVDHHSARFRLTPADAANLFHRLDDGQLALRVRAPEPPPAAPESAADSDPALAR